MSTTPARRFKDQVFEQFARVGKAVASPKRLELLDVLCQGPYTVERLAERTAITVANALPLSLAVPIGSERSNSISLGGGCRMLVDFPFVLLPTAFVDAAGNAATPMPVPNSPAYLGQSLFFQWAVLDPNGPFLGDFALSGGLQMRMGD